MIHLKLVQGKHVRDPKTKKLLGPEGIKVDVIDTYWHRRLVHGDVEIVGAAAKSEVSAKPPKKEPKEKGV